MGQFEGFFAWGMNPACSSPGAGKVREAMGKLKWMVNVNLVHQPFPSWLVSPYFALGTGVVNIEPKATLVQAESRTDQEAHVGFGLRTYLSERFLIRAEYRSYVIFTKRDSNEEVDEWKAGFAFFF